ncbi:MAG: maleylpyruvate isomerase family mycothiol-dependent enzyme [Propionibacteriales bacterium]|nr:maleylpyruvate isomerase family mycothiol-dependent enzyme [Propionibacteriales bacterium]
MKTDHSTLKDARIARKEARVLATDEFDKFAALVASLTPQEWAADTDCVGWDVRKMVLHVLGSSEAQASPLVFLHQLRRGVPLNKEIDSHHWVDGMNELQIRERSGLSNAEVVEQVAAIGARAVKGRFGTPLPMRYTPVPFGDPIGWKPVNYLLEVGFTRDVWAHRIDIHVAIGRPMELDPAHDGRLVADIVAEWAALHGEPFALTLTGPAGGTFSQGQGGERVEIDALDFIRTLAGRLVGTGVLRHVLPL